MIRQYRLPGTKCCIFFSQPRPSMKLWADKLCLSHLVYEVINNNQWRPHVVGRIEALP